MGKINGNHNVEDSVADEVKQKKVQKGLGACAPQALNPQHLQFFAHGDHKAVFSVVPEKKSYMAAPVIFLHAPTLTNSFVFEKAKKFRALQIHDNSGVKTCYSFAVVKRELALLNFSLEGSAEEKRKLDLAFGQASALGGEVFTLKTCQRLLLAGFGTSLSPFTRTGASCQKLEGTCAYAFLLETICGLKSHILGENEIVHQFKSAYRNWINGLPNPHLLKVLEKLFKDAKYIRREYLGSIGRPTYAGIVRKMILHRDMCGPLAVIGSGELAKSLAKIIPQRYRPHLFARNSERVEQLRSECRTETIEWEDWDSLATFPLIVNTVGSRAQSLFPDTFLSRWSANHGHKMMVCLGEPSPVPDHWNRECDVFKLSDVLLVGKTQNRETLQKAERARNAIAGLSRTHYPRYAHRFFVNPSPNAEMASKIVS